MRKHPELKQILNDFTSQILLEKVTFLFQLGSLTTCTSMPRTTSASSTRTRISRRSSRSSSQAPAAWARFGSFYLLGYPHFQALQAALRPLPIQRQLHDAQSPARGSAWAALLLREQGGVSEGNRKKRLHRVLRGARQFLRLAPGPGDQDHEEWPDLRLRYRRSGR